MAFKKIKPLLEVGNKNLIRTLSDFKSEKLIEIKDGKINVVKPEKLKHLLY